MPEALETWKVSLIQRVLPRHMLIIYRINQEFLDEVVRLYPGDIDLMRRVSLIDDGGGHEQGQAGAHGAPVHRRQPPRERRLAAAFGPDGADHLCRLRAALSRTFPQQDQRRHPAALAGAIQSGPVDAARRTPRQQGLASAPGSSEDLRSSADDAAFRTAFAAAKRGNKVRLANYVAREVGITLDPGQPVRRPGQADPRIQTAVAQRAARDHALQRAPATARPGTTRRAA
jgi:starch phosphorylase